MNWGIPALVVVAAAAFGAAQPSIPPSPLLPQSVNIALKVERDGRLTVTEQVFVQARHGMTRRVPLRIGAGDDRDRVFSVRDVTVDGNGSTEITGDEFVMRLGEGATTVTYTVDGAVVDLGDRQEARWQVASGWDVEVRFLRASFIAPDQPDSVVCLAGALGSTSTCESAQTDHGQVLRVVQQNLKPGNRIDLSVGLPPGTVPANARFDAAASTGLGAFAIGPVSGIGLGVLTLLVLGGFLLLWLARGRDAKALATDVGPVDVLLREGDRVSFASPDGVLPGQIGTVVDERVDPADITATVVDLAVRNYLRISEISGDDWLLVRRNAFDEGLTGYERAAVEALLPEGTDRVRVSELSTVDLDTVRTALYADVVARKWFTRRPDHGSGRLAAFGAATTLLGIAATVVLALTVGHALIGVALVIGGVALILGARWVPARTGRGRALVQQVRGLLGYLRTADRQSIPDTDRELVLSRAFPYAVVLGDTEHWLSMVGDANPHWYEGSTANLPNFLAALTRTLERH